MKSLKLLVVMLVFSLSVSAKDGENPILNGIKEAGNGIAWMAKTQLCLFAYAMWSWNVGYHCNHPEHWDSIKSIEKK